MTHSYKKESASSNSSSSSYSDKSILHYPFTINEIIKDKYRVNLYFLFYFLLIIYFLIYRYKNIYLMELLVEYYNVKI